MRAPDASMLLPDSVGCDRGEVAQKIAVLLLPVLLDAVPANPTTRIRTFKYNIRLKRDVSLALDAI